MSFMEPSIDQPEVVEFERFMVCQGDIFDDEGDPTGEVCEFVGEVECEGIGWTIYWTCPECGYEHETDVEEIE